MGVWIETIKLGVDQLSSQVTPFVGVWIETDKQQNEKDLNKVTPFVGVWIETAPLCCRAISVESHPSWVCGLKLLSRSTKISC